MSTTYSPGRGRTAQQLNEQIRHLMLRSGGWLNAEQRREYEQLITAWADAVHAERTEDAADQERPPAAGETPAEPEPPHRAGTASAAAKRASRPCRPSPGRTAPAPTRRAPAPSSPRQTHPKPVTGPTTA